jgi:acetyl-CoA acetyltransferase
MTDVVIAGAGETAYTRHPSPQLRTELLLATAARQALDDAGLDASSIDGLGVVSFTLRPDHAIDLAWKLGLRLRWLMEDTNGGASTINLLQHAVRAVEAGDASAVLLLAGDLFSAGDFADLVDNYNAATRDYLAPLGYGGPNSLFAMLTQRHMAAHGLAREDYGRVAVAQRAWAAGNDGAVYRAPLSLDEYLAQPMVADPLSRLDCVPVVAGADALIVTARERARDGVGIRAIRTSYNYDHQAGDGLVTGLRELAGSLWDAAGFGPGDVALANVYDDYPVMVLVQLTDLGFAPEGDVARLVRERVGPRTLPVNTSGGQLSAGQAGTAGSMHGVVEAVRQLRGRAGARQVAAARRAVVSGYGMVLHRYCACANAVVLERQATS